MGGSRQPKADKRIKYSTSRHNDGYYTILNTCYITSRGRHLKYCSVISITLRNVFALSHNALTLLGSVIASIICCSGLIGVVFASYSYCTKLIGQCYCFHALSLFHYSVSAFHFYKTFE
jgi:hypothetical protein